MQDGVFIGRAGVISSIPEEDLVDKVSQVFKKVQRTGVPMKGMEHYVWLKDGNRKQVEISVSPIKGTGNQGGV